MPKNNLTAMRINNKFNYILTFLFFFLLLDLSYASHMKFVDKLYAGHKTWGSRIN
jgi:hypothetical protein